MDTEVVIYLVLGVAFSGAVAWQGSYVFAERWLSKNDPLYQPPSFMARLFIGRLFLAFKPMARYKALRVERQQGTFLNTLFWLGLGTAGLGLIGFLVLLPQL